MRLGRIVTYELAVTDVESSTVDMGALGGCVSVHPAETPDSNVGAKQARHLKSVSTATTAVERVGKALSDLLEKISCMRPQVCIGVRECIDIDKLVRRGTNQSFPVSSTVRNRRPAHLLSHRHRDYRLPNPTATPSDVD